MLRSMTGFGRCLMESQGITQQWEIRSVNGRHLDIKWRLPAQIHGVEPLLEKLIRQHAFRGRVDVSLYLQFAEDYAMHLKFNTAQANAMLDALANFAKKRHDNFVPDYHALLRIQDLWRDNSDELADEILADLQEGLALAIDDWNDGRRIEGEALAKDLQERIALMIDWTRLIAERAPVIKEERTQILHERLQEALEHAGLELNEPRFLQEVVILADHLDVTEELTRLNTHLERLSELLTIGEDVGRRLDFTLQECFREITTCGNKICDAEIAHIVVDFKNELEKCREQVQNLE